MDASWNSLSKLVVNKTQGTYRVLLFLCKLQLFIQLFFEEMNYWIKVNMFQSIDLESETYNITKSLS